MAINLLSQEPLEGNAALFENDAIQGQNQGDITWSEPEDVGNDKWSVTIEGTDVEGGTIDPTTTEVDGATKPTPSQVFWFVAKVLKEVLCPECGPGY